MFKIDEPPQPSVGGARSDPTRCHPQPVYPARRRQLLQHILLPLGQEVPRSPRTTAPATVDYGDRIVCAVCCRGPAQIVAMGHEPVDIPEGE